MDIKALQIKLANRGFHPGPADGILGKRTYAAIMGFIVGRQPTAMVLDLAEGCVQHLPGYAINSRMRLAHFFSQCAAESSGFTDLEENLGYSAQRLTQVWPKRFPTLAAAQPYARNPEALANKTYGGRMGNDKPGDGWKYRGRGIKMLTGKNNYRAASQWTGLDLLNHPDLAAVPQTSVKIAGAFWKANNIYPFADRDDLQAVTKAINGGLIGFDLRSRYLVKAKEIL